MSRCYLCIKCREIKCREITQWSDVELIIYFLHKNAMYNAHASYQSTTLDTIREPSLLISSQSSKKTRVTIANDSLNSFSKLCSLTLLLQYHFKLPTTRKTLCPTEINDRMDSLFSIVFLIALSRRCTTVLILHQIL